MLVLITSTFFSDFMIYFDAITWPSRVVALLLPTRMPFTACVTPCCAASC